MQIDFNRFRTKLVSYLQHKYVGRKSRNIAYSTVSPHLRRAKPDISISIHGLNPGYFQQFRKPENILDGVDHRVLGTRGSTIKYCTLYSHATGYWPIFSCHSLTVKRPLFSTQGKL